MNNKKIIKIIDLVTKLSKFNKKIGLCHGVFDLLHLGHINHFNEAKRNCDILIVSVTQDKYVSKGPGRPVFNQKQRMEALSNLVSVDFVVLSEEQSAVEIINNINKISKNLEHFLNQMKKGSYLINLSRAVNTDSNSFQLSSSGSISYSLFPK